MRTRLLGWAWSAWLLATGGAGGAVLEVGGSGAFADIQSAIAAAAPGDVILVDPGTYGAFTLQAKGVVVQARVPGTVLVNASCPGDPVIVRDVPVGQSVLFAGLTIQACANAPAQRVVYLLNDQGLVRLEDCVLEMVEIFDADASFIRCQVTGYVSTSPGAFRHAISALAASIDLQDSTLIGAAGSGGTNVGAAGGAGVHVRSSQLFVRGCMVQGGAGGSVTSCPAQPGKGGDAIHASDGSTCYAVDSTLLGGAGGFASAPCSGQADPGLPQSVDGSSTFAALPGLARGLQVTSPVVVPGTGSLTFEGVPGDLLLLFLAKEPSQVFLPYADGVVGVGPPVVLVHGTVNGTLQIQAPVPPLPAGMTGVIVFLQAAGMDAGGAVFLSNPNALVILQ